MGGPGKVILLAGLALQSAPAITPSQLRDCIESIQAVL